MFTFKVIPEGGEPYLVEATSRDVLQWERRNKGANITDLRDKMRFTDLYKIAHLASVRQDLFTGTEADFAATVDLDLVDDDEPDGEDPTPAAP